MWRAALSGGTEGEVRSPGGARVTDDEDRASTWAHSILNVVLYLFSEGGGGLSR